MYLNAEGYKAADKSSVMFYIDQAQRGGWGKFTMGLLLPTPNMAKSYGIFGMDKSIEAKAGPPVIEAFDAQGTS